MNYRRFGRQDWKASILGFGTMRLPVIDGDTGQIDEPTATAMLRFAIDQGVNYVDAAYTYHQGQAEHFLGRALADGYREKVRIATKLPCWLAEKKEDFDRLLDEQLERLQLESIDYYMLHSLNRATWNQVRELGVLDWAERSMVTGKFDAFGFSFHDSYEVFREIVDAYDNWTLCQIQYNYMDEEYQAGRQGLEYAAERGLAVVVMEPIRGGFLARRPPASVQALWDRAGSDRSPVAWALQWVWHHPEVTLALSGMSAIDHVVENVAIADRSRSGDLTDDELVLIAKVADAYRALSPIPCTGCGYCLPCPNGVNIPRNFEIYNEAMMYETVMERRFAVGRVLYSWLAETERAGACLQCGECEAICPQGIDIIDWLARCHESLG